MINNGQYDPMEQANYTGVMHSFEGSSSVYRWLLEQEEFVVDFEQTSISVATIAAALINSPQLNASECLEAVIAHGCDLNNPAVSFLCGDGLTLVHRASYLLKDLADNLDFPRRIKVLWDAGADFYTPFLHNKFERRLIFYLFWISRVENVKYGVEREFTPTPPLMLVEDTIDYDPLEDTSAINHRLRTSKSLWRTWYPGHDFSILEIVQRHLDAWMEVLLEAGLDTVDYGCREDQLHPDARLCVEARLHFEYGDHVGGCRIHVTKILVYEELAAPAETPTMPGSWDFGRA